MHTTFSEKSFNKGSQAGLFSNDNSITILNLKKRLKTKTQIDLNTSNPTDSRQCEDYYHQYKLQELT